MEGDREAALQAVESVDASRQAVSRSWRKTASRGRGRGAALGSTGSVAAPRARPASGPTVPPGSESADVEEEEEWEEEVEERKGEKRPLSPVPPEEERESVPQESRIRRMANVLFVWVQR